MAQNFTQIQQAFDTVLAGTIGSASISGITQILTYTENDVSNFAMLPSIKTSLGVRITLIPTKTIVETIGVSGYVSVNGMYAVDVFSQINLGYEPVAQLCDVILAAFPRGFQLTLTNGDVINVRTSSPSPTTNQGGWAMNKLYCRQVIVEFFGYVQP